MRFIIASLTALMSAACAGVYVSHPDLWVFLYGCVYFGLHVIIIMLDRD